MITRSNDEDFAHEIAARLHITAENANSCPQLMGLGQILSSEDTTIRRERLRIHLRQYRTELIAELAAFGIELQWPTPEIAESNAEPYDWHDALDDDPLNGKFQETDKQESFDAANRARAYINSTF
jgi:hypothetical protein